MRKKKKFDYDFRNAVHQVAMLDLMALLRKLGLVDMKMHSGLNFNDELPDSYVVIDRLLSGSTYIAFAVEQRRGY